ncbi:MULTISPECIES: inositol monophosphatase family protein [Thiomicrorhabdus]|uniref:Inositol monophosphatase family protein n=1 Tax=Thiomicrorhabdus heinhorstiae TaxID=2748010 RepID=A0ABS0BTQ3_9GAMM|nr:MULTISPECIES: inositol monophosphatase family protein [Thiomicrorhabdus]MBF6057208.1 inositol monophosphatase family protein [Thiomicrorhabdus heinhorstiae]
MIKHPFQENSAWTLLKQGVRSLAKQEVLSRFEVVSAEEKLDGSLLTEADTQMQIQTEAFLQANWPQFAFLGEEQSQSEQETALKSPQGCWILDPVDGTSNFASGIPVYAVSLALMIEGQVVAGLVYDPDRDEMFAARIGQGAELNDKPLIAKTAKQQLKQTSGIIDFKRLTPELACRIIHDNPYSSQRSFGSVALDWCWIAAGRGHIYLHGAQNIWDYAAGYVILHEAGGVSSTLNGEDVLVTQVVKRSAVAATTPELFAQWSQYLRG